MHTHFGLHTDMHIQTVKQHCHLEPRGSLGPSDIVEPERIKTGKVGALSIPATTVT